MKSAKSLSQLCKSSFSSQLKEAFKAKIPGKQAELKEIKTKYGASKLGDITVDQVIGGMRGMVGLLSDTSAVHPEKGIRFREYSIPELEEKCPGAFPGGQPLPESIYWLLVTGDIPTKAQADSVTEEWKVRGQLKPDVKDFIKALPKELHPMTMLSMSVLYQQKNSIFSNLYAQGKTNKKDYWDYFFEDTMTLNAQIAPLAAYIFRHKYHNSEFIEADNSLDWAANYAQMLGYNSDAFKECMRGYLTIHTDHEGGNVSAHATHLVGSALSDPYLSYSAGINGLAGPLHGLANQEVLKWLLEFTDKKGFNPTQKDVDDYVDELMASGRVVPGYGHAVLRQADPRFTHQLKFQAKHIKHPLVDCLAKVSTFIPVKLGTIGKIKNPWPNVDAGTGVTLYSLGFKEFEFYTVMFAVSRCLGVNSNLIWSRAMGLPIERPGSITHKALLDKFAK